MAEDGQRQPGWLGRLRQGLARSSAKLGDGIAALFTKRKLDEAALAELEEVLIAADLGPALAARLTAALARERFGREVGDAEVRTALAEQITTILAPVAQSLQIDRAHRPFVVLVVGVNGTGKTTTIGKLARLWRGEGYSVALAAGDTFRAAAIEQLTIWGNRVGAPVHARPAGADPAALAYEALTAAGAAGTDILAIDTAGRLHNKANLMDELAKIVRVMRKVDATAPHAVVLVLDAGTGQNAIAQAEAFRKLVDVTGLIVTKLDGTARAGVLVSLADQFGLPVHAIGVGEGADDLRPFAADSFARALVGLDRAD